MTSPPQQRGPLDTPVSTSPFHLAAPCGWEGAPGALSESHFPVSCITLLASLGQGLILIMHAGKKLTK